MRSGLSKPNPVLKVAKRSPKIKIAVGSSGGSRRSAWELSLHPEADLKIAAAILIPQGRPGRPGTLSGKGVPSGAVGSLCGMGARFIGVDREQVFLMPPSLRDWVPEGHLVWTVLDAVGELDMSAFLCRVSLGWSSSSGV
jgi:hypothetical protein